MACSAKPLAPSRFVEGAYRLRRPPPQSSVAWRIASGPRASLRQQAGSVRSPDLRGLQGRPGLLIWRGFCGAKSPYQMTGLAHGSASQRPSAKPSGRLKLHSDICGAKCLMFAFPSAFCVRDLPPGHISFPDGPIGQRSWPNWPNPVDGNDGSADPFGLISLTRLMGLPPLPRIAEQILGVASTAHFGSFAPFGGSLHFGGDSCGANCLLPRSLTFGGGSAPSRLPRHKDRPEAWSAFGRLASPSLCDAVRRLVPQALPPPPPSAPGGGRTFPPGGPPLSVLASAELRLVRQAPGNRSYVGPRRTKPNRRFGEDVGVLRTRTPPPRSLGNSFAIPSVARRGRTGFRPLLGADEHPAELDARTYLVGVVGSSGSFYTSVLRGLRPLRPEAPKEP